MAMLISQNLREEIRLKHDKIVGSPDYYEKRKKFVMRGLRSIGDVYSFWIENPELRKALLLENKKPETIRKKAQKGIQAVHNGWYFLVQKANGNMFIDVFDETILERLNGLIEPKLFYTGKFRKKDVTLNIPGYTPPSWEKIPEKVSELISKVKELYKKDPLESAIFAHLSIAAIQPFIEGNKRCARLLQDRLLYDAQFPPAIIQAGEGKFYFGLLVKTIPAYSEGNLESQRQFFDYCASKVNNGLDEILNDLSVKDTAK